jgi:hypothetical protein
MRKFLLLLIILCSTTIVNAQSTYNRAIGVKAPGGFSITYKQFLTDNNNAEAQLTLWNKGFRTSALYEFNFYSFKSVEGLSWFVGPGVHVGFWKDTYAKDYNSNVDFGIDGIIGFDYKFKDIPINASIDWQPSVTLVGTTGFSPSYGGLAVRYTFKKNLAQFFI